MSLAAMVISTHPALLAKNVPSDTLKLEDALTVKTLSAKKDPLSYSTNAQLNIIISSAISLPKIFAPVKIWIW